MMLSIVGFLGGEVSITFSIGLLFSWSFFFFYLNKT